MNLLTEHQINTATEDDLLELLRAIKRRLSHLSEQIVLTVAKETLARLDVTGAARVTFGVDEWDDGYFWSDITKVETASGAESDLPQTALDALSEALEEPLSNLAYGHGGLGRFDQLTIDLVENVLYH